MDSRMQKLMLWLRAVAMPAPAVPSPNPKMNTGSSTIQRDVQHAAGDQTDHGEAGLALVAQDVVHHKAGHHQRCRDQDGPRVGARVRQDGLGAAQQHHEVGQGSEADSGKDQAEGQRCEEAGGREPGGSLGVLAAEAPADDAARAVAQHKAQRLNDGHQAGNDPHRAGRAGGDLADEEGVSQVIDAGDEHTQNRRCGKAEDEFRDGRLGHLPELLRRAVFCGHKRTSLSQMA